MGIGKRGGGGGNKTVVAVRVIVVVVAVEILLLLSDCFLVHIFIVSFFLELPPLRIPGNRRVPTVSLEFCVTNMPYIEQEISCIIFPILNPCWASHCCPPQT